MLHCVSLFSFSFGVHLLGPLPPNSAGFDDLLSVEDEVVAETKIRASEMTKSRAVMAEIRFYALSYRCPGINHTSDDKPFCL